MHYSLLVLTIILAIIEWSAVAKSWRMVEYFFKPAVMVSLIALLITAGSLSQFQSLIFTIGALFSLLGDIFLILPRERIGFPLGLSAFFLAQLFYIKTYLSNAAFQGIHSLILAGVLLILLAVFGSKLLKSLLERDQKKLIIPIALYMTAISIMVFSAVNLNFEPAWKFTPALLVSLGAVFFAASDTILSWNKFITPLHYGRIALMICYHVGQILMASGVILQFL